VGRQTHHDVTNKTITLVLNISTYITTSITALPIGLVVILAIIYVSTFKTAVILYIQLYILHRQTSLVDIKFMIFDVILFEQLKHVKC
jgi:hypothetical protein